MSTTISSDRLLVAFDLRFVQMTERECCGAASQTLNGQAGVSTALRGEVHGECASAGNDRQPLKFLSLVTWFAQHSYSRLLINEGYKQSLRRTQDPARLGE
ncbi:hypothetical protein N7522_002675 [Penicillium canescens]|nr:hypothetical protein N7522_002675 [Penicillium canescens]